MTDEVWLPMVGYEGRYDVSSAGRVWSHLSRRHLQPQLNQRHGYLGVTLHGNGKQRTQYVHRLVAAAFLGPKPKGMEVRHLDGDPTNNALSNLAYGTRVENEQDKLRHGTHHYAKRDHCKYGHPFTPENTIVTAKQRFCRECARRRNRDYRARKKV